MDESTTRRRKIDPALYAVGWEQVPESEILNEQRAYLIAPGRVEKLPVNRHPKKVDYILEYRHNKLAVIEAKADELPVEVGIAQAKQYAEMLQIRYAYSTNGDEIYFIDMGVRDPKGNFIKPSSEHLVDRFPSPQELWQMTFPDANEWRDKFNLEPFNLGGGRKPRYYQVNAVNNVLSAVAREQKRILLTMATGTGKTYVAFQICWKLFQTNWNKRFDGRKPRILFISDRNILANQAVNDFEQFNEDAIVRITPDKLHKKQNKVPTERHLYFTIFQTFMSEDEDKQPFYKQYPADFFDFIIIDECHRGGANDESQWRELMDYFADAYQLGMTATPRHAENANTYKYFGEPVYTYSLKQGIEDGYLTPFRVCISESNIDTYQYDPNDDVEGDIDPNRIYTEKDFYNGDIEMRDRDIHRVEELLSQINPNDKTIIFCATQAHAAIICALINQRKSNPDPNYCKRVTADDGQEGENLLKLFQNNERSIPTILTTSQKLSTGVDARNVRNIVLLRPINNMVEFKQIIGRGTRLFDDKYFFTIYDFVGAHARFKDEGWEGEPPICPICGNYPCTCHKHKPCPKCGQYPCICQKEPPKPCPKCGNLPCTCQNPPKKKIRVKLSDQRILSLQTDWTEKFYFGNELITIDELIHRLFGQFSEMFKSPEDLRNKWENPDTRQLLLDELANRGFGEDKLDMIRRVMGCEGCDLYDILVYLAYDNMPLPRSRRVELVKKEYYQAQPEPIKKFLDFLMPIYENNGYKEIAADNLSTLLKMMYGTIFDAQSKLQMNETGIEQFYRQFQKALYKPLGARGGMALNIHIDHVDTFKNQELHIS